MRSRAFALTNSKTIIFYDFKACSSCHSEKLRTYLLENLAGVEVTHCHTSENWTLSTAVVGFLEWANYLTDKVANDGTLYCNIWLGFIHYCYKFRLLQQGKDLSANQRSALWMFAQPGLRLQLQTSLSAAIFYQDGFERDDQRALWRVWKCDLGGQDACGSVWVHTHSYGVCPCIKLTCI